MGDYISKPQYRPLECQSAPNSLIIADGEGASAIFDFAKSLPKEFWSTANMIYISRDQADTTIEKLQQLGARSFYARKDYGAASQAIAKELADSKAGTQIYLAGSDGVMGLAVRDAMNAGFAHTRIQQEKRGPNSRRMQCVHCKGVTEDVTTDPFMCVHCELTLFVRDHYSRRLAAYQAVRVDADNPGDIPKTEEL